MLEHVLWDDEDDYVTLLDDDDAHFLAEFHWRAAKTHKSHRYVLTGWGKSTVYLHRLILTAGKGEQVDHINGNTLDNRRKNLRLCTRAQNQHNRAGWAKKRASFRPDNVFKGVWRSSRGRTFEAKICWQGRQRYIGTFHTAEEAAQAYDDYARTFHASFARLNFPQKGEAGVHDKPWRDR